MAQLSEMRIPLWIVAVVAGLGVLTVVGLFFYGSYVGVGSGM
ncbi:MAG: photosystem II reaction center protein J [Synechococcales cyanobacterium]